MAADRSPNFPNMSLGSAIDAIKLIYQREGRAKMPRLSAVKPLGYSSINGRSLSVIGALKGYGLLDGRGDELRVSEDAVTILNAPANSSERREALRRAFEGPPSFALLSSHGTDSPDTLRWHLIKAGFRDDSAERLVKIYLASKELVNADSGAYSPSQPASATEHPGGTTVSLDEIMDTLSPRPGSGAAKPPQPPSGGGGQAGLAMGTHERVLQSGLLSKGASYRLIVSGHLGKAEFDKLLAKLKLDEDILTDDDEGRPNDEDRDPSA